MDKPPLIPVGYRFDPTDEELVGHYLKHKLLGNDSIVNDVIPEINVCDFEPWDLPAYSKVKLKDQEWFFISPRLKFKEASENRSKRKTKDGYWKPTGKDRNIKTRGTDNVIGTKKTLVFYKGRSARGVKTNWVVHEYHAVTSPLDKGGFVLCRLMKKPEKKKERGADTMINDKGEPSSHTTADFENQTTVDRIHDKYTLPEVNQESIFPTPPQTVVYELPSLQQSTFVIEQEQSSQHSTFPNANFGKENSTKQIPFESTEEEDNLDILLQDFIAGQDAFLNNSTLSPFWNKAYFESSETDAEPLSALHCSILGTSTSVFNEQIGSREAQAMPMVKSSHDVVYADPPPVPSRNEVHPEEKDITCFPMFLVQNLSPPPSRAKSPSPSRRYKGKYHLGSTNYGSRRADRSQGPGKVSSQVVSPQEAQKETLIQESNKEQRKVQGTSAAKNFETTSNQSSAVCGKSSSTYLSTPLSVKLLKHDGILGTTSLAFNEHTGSRENLAMSTVQSLLDAVNASPPSLSSKNEVNKEKKDISSSDEFWEQDADDDSIAYEPLTINMIQRVTHSPSLPSTRSPSPPRTRSPSPSAICQNKYHLKSHNFVSLRSTAGKPQTKRNILSRAVSQQEAPNETQTLELNKEQRKAQGTGLRRKSEITCNVSPGVIGKGSFIHLETPLIQRSWFLFTWSCAWSCWHSFEFHHEMMHKVKLKGVSK